MSLGKAASDHGRDEELNADVRAMPRIRKIRARAVQLEEAYEDWPDGRSATYVASEIVELIDELFPECKE